MGSRIDYLGIFKASGLLKDRDRIRLHLGCGKKHFEGYINIDFPLDSRGSSRITADFYTDIRDLRFPPECIDEIRLHHVFEHFGRVEALALLIRWHSWLKIGGLLRIETPDIINSAKTLLSSTSWKTKMGVIRHLAGDQTTKRGYHLDHWFADRFKHTFKKFGFAAPSVINRTRGQAPYLSDIEVYTTKLLNISFDTQIDRAASLLFESTVSPAEVLTYKIWVSQLLEFFKGDNRWIAVN